MSNHRTTGLVLAARTLCVTGALPLAPALAGDLDPGPGPVAPTMKSLDDLAPGVPINDLPGAADAVHLIDTPGHYYLSADVTAPAGKSAVLVDIEADPNDVVIELNGFSLGGEPGSLDGIHVSAQSSNAVTLDGRLSRDTSASSISGFDGDGIHVENCPALSLSGLRVSTCGGNGIFASTPAVPGNYRFNLEVVDTLSNTLDGISILSQDGRSSLLISGSDTSGNGGSGIDVNLSGAAGASLTVSGTTTISNASHGIHVHGTMLQPAIPGEPVKGINVSLEQIPAVSNGGDGVHLEFDDTAQPALRLASSSLRDNTGDGLDCRSSVAAGFADIDVQDSDASHNGASGLHVSGNLTVQGATCSGNGNDGIQFVAPGEPVKGINVSLEQIVGSSNQGSGITFESTQAGGPASLRVQNSTFDDNDEYGADLNNDSDADFIAEWMTCSASGNALGGFLEDHAPSTAKRRSRRRRNRAHANNGPGISTTADIVELVDCSASANTGDGIFVVSDTVTVVACGSTDNGGDGYELTADDPMASQFANLIDSFASRNSANGTLVVNGSLEIQGGAMSGNGGDGINASNAGTTNAVRCMNTDCSLNVGGGLVVSGGSLHLDAVSAGNNGSDGVFASENRRFYIVGGNFNENAGCGIRALDVSGTLTIEGATCSTNTDRGILYGSSAGTLASSVSIRDCVADDNATAGISVSDTAAGRITGCSAFSNGTLGIELTSLSHVVTNNVCGNNPGGNYAVTLPGNALGPLQDEISTQTTDNASNYQP